jgi:hypothetical protein
MLCCLPSQAAAAAATVMRMSCIGVFGISSHPTTKVYGSLSIKQQSLTIVKIVIVKRQLLLLVQSPNN